MNQKVVDYLQENRDEYSQESLVEQLRNAGHDEREINEAVKNVYRAKDIPLPKQTQESRNEKITKDASYASFWLRVGAALIDGAIGYMAYMMISFFVALGGYLIGDSVFGLLLGTAAIVFVVDFAYRTVMVHYYQATIGKLAVGIKVCDENNFTKLSFKNVVIRELMGSVINRFYLNFIHIIVNFTTKQQSVHDMASHAVVVRKNKV